MRVRRQQMSLSKLSKRRSSWCIRLGRAFEVNRGADPRTMVYKMDDPSRICICKFFSFFSRSRFTFLTPISLNPDFSSLRSSLAHSAQRNMPRPSTVRFVLDGEKPIELPLPALEDNPDAPFRGSDLLEGTVVWPGNEESTTIEITSEKAWHDSALLAALMSAAYSTDGEDITVPKGCSLSLFISVLSYFGTDAKAGDFRPHPSETLGYRQSFTNACACETGVKDAYKWFIELLELRITSGLPTSHIVLVAYASNDSSGYLRCKADPDALIMHMGMEKGFSRAAQTRALTWAFWMGKEDYQIKFSELVRNQGFSCTFARQSFQIGTEGIEFSPEPGPTYELRWCCHLNIADDDDDVDDTSPGQKRKR